MISLSNLPPLVFRTNPSCRLHLNLKTSRNLIHSTSLCALKTESSGGGGGDFGPDLLKKPLIAPSSLEGVGLQPEEERGISKNEGYGAGDDDKEDDWVDWEDQILEDTVPLVGFVRMLLHSGKYGSGDKLSPEHEKTILERVLPYHPEFEKKIGCGIDYIKVDYHPDFEDSRCLFIVRKDGQCVDFSYWKCIKGLIKRNYPLYANSFIVRHFRRSSSRNA